MLYLIIDNESRTAIVKLTDWQAEITIHKCPPDVDNENFYIYRLAPAFDQTAYCAGEGAPCPEGYAYNGTKCVGKHQYYCCDLKL